MVNRKEYKAVTQRNSSVVAQIKEIKSNHPFWGYRRVWAYLNYHAKLSISQNKVYRLMKQHQLLVPKNMKLKAKRSSPARPKPVATRGNQYWGIDMTKVKINHFGYVYLVFVIDWYTKKILACTIDQQSKSSHWIKALDDAVNLQFPNGIKDSRQELAIISDNGCQPTSGSFMKYCGTLNINQIFTSFNNPKGNAETERLMRTFKEECVCILPPFLTYVI